MEGLDYEVKLVDQMSGPSQAASQSLSTLARNLLDTKEKLALYQQQAALSKQLGDAGAYSKYNALIGDQKVKLLELNEVVGGAAAAKRTLATSDTSLAGSIAGATAALGPYAKAIAAVAAAAFGAAAAIGYLTLKGAELAITSTQDKQAMVGQFEALTGTTEAGVETEEMLSRLSNQIGMTKDELAPFTAKFSAMGIEGTAALERVTRAAASAQAIMRDPAAGQAFEMLTRKIQAAVQTSEKLKVPLKGLGSLAEMGVRVDDVAKRMGLSAHVLAEQLRLETVNAKNFGDALQVALVEKGASALERLSNSMGSIKKIFIQDIQDIFEDNPAVAGFMAQVKDLFSIFNQSTQSGQALKTQIGGAFTYLLEAATPVILAIKHFFQEIIILSLKAEIYIKKHWGEIAQAIHGVGYVLKIVADIFLLSLLPISAALASIAQSAFIVISVIGGIGDALADMKASGDGIGKALWHGLVSGISSGFTLVKEAAAGLGDAAKQGLKAFLGIKSPSRVMMQLGGYASAGFATGISQNTPQVVSASQGIGSAAVSGTSMGLSASDYAPNGSGVPDRAGSSSSVIGPITINLEAPEGVTNAVDLTEIAVATIFERLSLQQGM